MSVERLNHLITILEGVERANLAFNLDAWASNEALGRWQQPHTNNLVGNLDETCGTACCAMGYAALDPTFQAQGLRMNLRAETDEGLFDTTIVSIDQFNILMKRRDLDFDFVGIRFEHHAGFNAAAEFFDIPYSQADWIFCPDCYPANGRPITPRMVIERIQGLLAE